MGRLWLGLSAGDQSVTSEDDIRGDFGPHGPSVTNHSFITRDLAVEEHSRLIYEYCDI